MICRGADWKIASEDVADVANLPTNPRSFPSRVELRLETQARNEAGKLKCPFRKHRDTLEHHERRWELRGRLAVAPTPTPIACPRGAAWVYCRSERFPGKPKLDIALVLEQLDDAKQLVQSAMEEMRKG